MKRRDFSSFRRTGRGNEGNECRGRFRQHAGHSVQLQAGACLSLGRPVLDCCRGGCLFRQGFGVVFVGVNSKLRVHALEVKSVDGVGRVGFFFVHIHFCALVG